MNDGNTPSVFCTSFWIQRKDRNLTPKGWKTIKKRKYLKKNGLFLSAKCLYLLLI